MPINAADVRCPKCSGPVWDERGNKKNPKGPDFKCKDVNCKDDKGYKTGIWERDLVKNGASAPAPAPTAKQAHSSGPHIEGLDEPSKLDGVLSLHDLCVMHAASRTQKLLRDAGLVPTAADILAAAATQMIGAQRAGATA